MSVCMQGSLMIKGHGCAHGREELWEERVTEHGPESAAGSARGKHRKPELGLLVFRLAPVTKTSLLSLQN